MAGAVAVGELRERRMAEPGARDAYEAARLAFELGRSVRELREQRGWSQSELAQAADMTQSAVARFEAGGTVPTLPVLERLARALGLELAVSFSPRTAAA
jgi:ribosome-binding protein aMBF1 (putative translation factor)